MPVAAARDDLGREILGRAAEGERHAVRVEGLAAKQLVAIGSEIGSEIVRDELAITRPSGDGVDHMNPKDMDQWAEDSETVT